MFKQFSFVLCFVGFWKETVGHGMMIDPPNRSSRWRYDSNAPINYNDNALYCGGFGIQWGASKGWCGICGDSYSDPRPRPNELGGTYGQGVIVAEYQANSIFNVTIMLVQNHKGTFTFSMCNYDASQQEEEECFQTLYLSDGSDKVPIYSEYGNRNLTYELRLPSGLTSEHSILRWNYRAGNNWGIDEDGTECLGCGPQETYRTCTDIAIK
ncbi:hypothetical protein FQA39_LY13806 [Lamprigera yunnana]|nr:hypothetical protein FQA39_LY13806 [Lamprigera yunnana]